jgi:hypothetical protein
MGTLQGERFLLKRIDIELAKRLERLNDLKQ